MSSILSLVPLVLAAMKLGGWIRHCSFEMEEWFFNANFLLISPLYICLYMGNEILLQTLTIYSKDLKLSTIGFWINCSKYLKGSFLRKKVSDLILLFFFSPSQTSALSCPICSWNRSLELIWNFNLGAHSRVYIGVKASILGSSSSFSKHESFFCVPSF